MGARGFAYVPALDGLRGVAVIAVVAFHSGFGWAGGGFLGVSLFFTLSGFLITSLLLDEHATSGSVALGPFFARRARRLLPAAMLCVGLVLAAATWWQPGQRARLPGDAAAAVLGVSNWRFIAADSSYRDLFIGGPSPLAHFWSLSIEQQCYLLLPVVVALALRRGITVLVAALAGLWALACVASVVTDTTDQVYQGTHTRAAELLAGALVAVLVARRVRWLRVPGWLTTAALVVFVVAAVVTGLRTEWLYRGGLAAGGVVWAVLIAGLMGSDGRPTVSRVLSSRPLVALGKVSYGVYLYHWPVFLLLTPQRLGTDGPFLHLIRVGVITLVVVASYVVVEEPVRRGQVLAGWRLGLAVPLTTAALLVAAVVAVPTPGYSRTEVLLATGDDGPVVFTTAAGSAIGGPNSVPSGVGSPRMSVAPEQPVALVVGGGTRPVQQLEAAGFSVVEGPQPGCPLVSGVELLLPDGTVDRPVGCESAVHSWRALADERFDVLVVVVADADAAVVRFAGDPAFPIDDAERARRAGRVEDELWAALQTLAEPGTRLVALDRSAGGAAGERIRKAAIRLGVDLRMVTTADGAVRTARDLMADDPAEVPVLLVLGDSTSLDLAQALHDGADGRLRVVWAGANGCPFAEVEATRPAPDREWSTANCPDPTEVLPALIAEHRPALVVVVSGPTELGEHRYEGSNEPAVAGDPRFADAHDEALDVLLALLPAGTPVVLADSPPVIAGGWATEEMADPVRLAAWNAQLARMVASPNDAVEAWAYAAAIADYEAEHGVIRADGVHPDVDALTNLARTRLVGELLGFLQRN